MPLNYATPINPNGYTISAGDSPNSITVTSATFGEQLWQKSVQPVSKNWPCSICGRGLIYHKDHAYKPLQQTKLNRSHKICLTCVRS